MAAPDLPVLEPDVIRLTCLCLVLSAFLAGPASAERLEVHSDVTRATITVQNDQFAVSAPPPFEEDLPAGRYRLSVLADGRRVGRYTIDVENGIRLRSTRVSRTISSAVLPGSGQWRDDAWWSGAVTGGGVALMLGRALYFNVKAGSAEEEADVGGTPSDELIRIGLDAEVHRATRDDYLFLAAGFYAANVIDAAVRRGPVRFTERAPGVVEARYMPTSVGQSMLLSAVVPGLGQVRQGSVGRGRIWNTLAIGTAYFWAQSQRQVEKARANVRYLEATGTPSDPGYAERLARLESDVDEQEAVARTAVYLAIGIWAYNIADAAFVARGAVADSGVMVRNDEESRDWTLSPGLVGENAGLVFDVKF
jgi:hypothetical protein